MGNASSATKYEAVGGASSARDEGEPPAVSRPSNFAAALARVEEACCCLKSEEIRRRRFDAAALPMISEGEVFVLRGWSPPRMPSSTLGKASGMFSRFFAGGGGVDDGGGDVNGKHEDYFFEKEMLGQPCMVTANRDFMLRWKSLALVNNHSKYRGLLRLDEVHHVRPAREAHRECIFELVNAQGAALATLEADSKTLRDNWVEALSAFLSIYASKIEFSARSDRNKSEKQLRMKSRRDAIEQRRLAAKAKISKLGLTGMRHSAKARMEATSV